MHFAQACPYQAWMKPESLRSIHSRECIEFLGRVFFPGRVTMGQSHNCPVFVSEQILISFLKALSAYKSRLSLIQGIWVE